MAEDKNVGLRSIYRCDVESYEKWKKEWTLITKLIRMKSAKLGIDLSCIELVGGGK